jgi:hypothetical protein
MLDIDTFIHMTRIATSGFVVGEDYNFFMTPLAVATVLFQPYESTTVPLSDFIF